MNDFRGTPKHRNIAPWGLAHPLRPAKPRLAMAPVNLPNLAGVTSALAKLTSAIEDDARDFIEKKIPAVDAKRQALFGAGGKAEKVLGQRADALQQIDSALDAVDSALGNGGPTSDGSKPSSSS